MLEIGVWKGESLLMWQNYFPKALITGIDIEPPPLFFPDQPRIRCYQGDQADLDFLAGVAKGTWPGGFHFIIDDASHLAYQTKKSFWYLFENHLLPGGLFAIEDWGVGYWASWPDGKVFAFEPDGSSGRMPTHQYGLVGFVKQLVDEQGRLDICRGAEGRYPHRPSRFESITIVPGNVFIRKAM